MQPQDEAKIIKKANMQASALSHAETTTFLEMAGKTLYSKGLPEVENLNEEA